MRNELIVVHPLILGPDIDNFYLWAGYGGMFVILLTVDIEPFGVVRVLHFLFSDLGGFIVIEGV